MWRVAMTSPTSQHNGRLNQMRKRAGIVRRPQMTVYVLSSWSGPSNRSLVDGCVQGRSGMSVGRGFLDAIVSLDELVLVMFASRS